ncbi:MAG TPA: FAD-binding oxidoreductase [Steroidobacteraceae bacterium]|nr:FAD-binding oxidoreductase [Steroidobacteraceae bacterium]
MSPLRRASSYYEATAHRAAPRPQLRGTLHCDVCVVGGGIAGCSTALHLAERGYRVVLLEGARIGSGASGRSGGQVLVGTAIDSSALAQLIGAQASRAVWDTSVEGVALLRALIARYDIRCHWVSGHLQVAMSARQERALQQELQQLEAHYHYRSARYLPSSELQMLLATRRYRAALYDSNGGHLHPLNYTLGLAAAAEQQGAQLFEDSRALAYARAGDAADAARLEVRTGQGRVLCRQLALCGNTQLGALAPELARTIMAVGTCIIATAPLGEARARELIANDAAVADMNWVLDYFRLSADHRLLFGGRVTYSGFDPERIAASTRGRMIGVFPQLRHVEVDYAWGGYIDITRSRAPHFGRLAPNVYFLQGFSGHGIALAGMAGKLLAEALAGTAERFDVFARIPHRTFPGGPWLRRPALVLAMLYFRLRDLL